MFWGAIPEIGDSRETLAYSFAPLNYFEPILGSSSFAPRHSMQAYSALGLSSVQPVTPYFAAVSRSSLWNISSFIGVLHWFLGAIPEIGDSRETLAYSFCSPKLL